MFSELPGGAAEFDVRQDRLQHAVFLVQLGIMALAVDVVADEPAHGAARHDIAGEVLIGGQACADHAAGVKVGQKFHPKLVMVLVREYGRQGERFNRVA